MYQDRALAGPLNYGRPLLPVRFVKSGGLAMRVLIAGDRGSRRSHCSSSSCAQLGPQVGEE